MARVETTTPVHEIERALFAIFRGSQSTKLHRQASRAAGVELDRAGFGALVSLGDQHLRMSELATRQGLDISTVSRRVAQLEAAGLRRELLEAVVADWTERDRREFARLLGRFAEDMSVFKVE